MTRERPILLSTPLVRAVLSGEKTQTRRLVKNTDEKTSRIYWAENIETVPRGKYTGWVRECDAPLALPMSCPFGVPGDRLWVRETWYDDNALRKQEPTPTGPDKYIEYRASHNCLAWEAGCPCRDDNGRRSWRPSLHMPRWASRLTLEITDVRVERVQQISERDANAEGVEELDGLLDEVELCRMAKDIGGCAEDARTWFAVLWDSIYGQKPGIAWRDNPWVWVIDFKTRPLREG